MLPIEPRRVPARFVCALGGAGGWRRAQAGVRMHVQRQVVVVVMLRPTVSPSPGG